MIAKARGRRIPSRGAGPLAEAGLVTQVDSLYNDINVYQEPDGLMLILRRQAAPLRRVRWSIRKDELDLPVTYTQSMTAGLAYARRPRAAMIIGLGGGRTAWYHHKSVPDLDFTAVELDPEVVRLTGTISASQPEPNFAIAIVRTAASG